MRMVAFGVISTSSIARPPRVITSGAPPGDDSRSRMVANRASETRSVSAYWLRSLAGSPASTSSAAMVPSGRSALSDAIKREGNARTIVSPRRTAMPSRPGTMRAAASAMLRPRSGVGSPASSISSDSRAVTLSPSVARTERIVSSPSAFTTARPVARRSMSLSPVASSPTPTSRPLRRSSTHTALVAGSSICAACASSAGSASASSQARAARNPSSAVFSSGVVPVPSGLARGLAGGLATGLAGGSAEPTVFAAASCVASMQHPDALACNRPQRRMLETRLRVVKGIQVATGMVVAMYLSSAALPRREHN